jgi:putative sigma-54 modulation protein
MKLKLSFRHMEPSASIVNKIEEKAAHLKKYFRDQIDVHWVCSIHGHQQRSDVNVHAGSSHFHAFSESDCLYKSFDEVIQKIERQLRKKNDRYKNKIHSNLKLSEVS